MKFGPGDIIKKAVDDEIKIRQILGTKRIQGEMKYHSICLVWSVNPAQAGTTCYLSIGFVEMRYKKIEGKR